MTAFSEYHRIASKALEFGSPSEAVKVASQGLNEYPNNVPLMICLGMALKQQRDYFQAAAIFEKAIGLNPDIKESWLGLSVCYADLGPYDERYYDRAIKVCEDIIERFPDETLGYNNHSYVDLIRSDYDNAFKFAQQAYRLNPQDSLPKYNMAMSFLANHMWPEGWDCYDANLTARYTLGIPEYGVPLWNGEEDCTVIVAGEQGLGDEIMFASMIPDLQKTNDVIIDSTARLAGLFGRTFNCEAHGDRFDNQAPWKRSHKADFWVPMGSLAAYYRTKPEDFPGKPYLTPDPQRRVQYRALLDSLGKKPKIGIAWTGGRPSTNQYHRSLSLRDLSPILEYDATWVSLQYKNTDCHDFIHHWPRATVECDYDETAALISELDMVISVTTTAIHCAGALGVETLCLVPSRPQWRYGLKGERLPWYESVELFREEEGKWPIEEICNRLSRMGIGKCSNRFTKTPITVLPRKRSHPSLPPSLTNAGLLNYLITGLAKAA